jgi:ABC-2 type transport system permease protein
MSALAAAIGVVRRDLSIFASYRTAFATQILANLFSLTLFYYISRLVTIGEFGSPDEYFAYAVIGILTLDIAISTLVFPPTMLRQELVAGTFERLVLSPFGALASVCAMAVFPVLWAIVRAMLSVAVAAVVFGLPISGPEAFLAVPVALLAAISFIPFGLMIAGAVLLIKQALGAGNWIVAGISILAGFYFPIALLPDWLQWASDVQPFTPAVELMRNLVVGTPMSESAWGALLQLVLFTAVLLPISVWSLRAALRTSRRRGTIIEY